MRRFQCLGKNKNGSRCKNKFLTSSYSTLLTCSRHSDQDVTFQYGDLSPNSFKDVAKLISMYIDDPKTFSSFAAVCRSTAKACHSIQDEKKREFAKVENSYGIEYFEYFTLPNGSIY